MLAIGQFLLQPSKAKLDNSMKLCPYSLRFPSNVPGKAVVIAPLFWPKESFIGLITYP